MLSGSVEDFLWTKSVIHAHVVVRSRSLSNGTEGIAANLICTVLEWQGWLKWFFWGNAWRVRGEMGEDGRGRWEDFWW